MNATKKSKEMNQSQFIILGKIWDLVKDSQFLKIIFAGIISVGGVYIDLKRDLQSLKDGQQYQLQLAEERYRHQMSKDISQDAAVEEIRRSVSESARDLKQDIRDLRQDLNSQRKPPNAR